MEQRKKGTGNSSAKPRRKGSFVFAKSQPSRSLRLRGGFCFFLLLAASGCVTTAQEGEQMRQDIAALRAELKKEVDTATQERQKLAAEQAQRSKALQEALDQLSRAARKSGADLTVDQEKAQNDITALPGQIEALQHRLDAIEKSQAAAQHQLDAANQIAA